ncbi:unnamed protein product [Boreogadus saida]
MRRTPGPASVLQCLAGVQGHRRSPAQEVDLQCEEPLFSDGSSEPRLHSRALGQPWELIRVGACPPRNIDSQRRVLCE